MLQTNTNALTSTTRPTDLDGYQQFSRYLDRDLRLILTHMQETPQKTDCLFRPACEKKAQLIADSLTPAIVIKFFNYRKCTHLFLNVLPYFIKQNETIPSDFAKVLVTRSKSFDMYPTDVFINRRLGLKSKYDNDFDIEHIADKTIKTVSFAQRKIDKKTALPYLQYISEEFQLSIPFSEKQVRAALCRKDKQLLELVPTEQIKSVREKFGLKGFASSKRSKIATHQGQKNLITAQNKKDNQNQ